MRVHPLGYISIISTLLVVFAGTAFAEPGQATPRYADRSMTLNKGTLRVDGGPSDFGLLDSGMINSGRGFRISDIGTDTAVSLGLGVGYGITDAFEVGALALPLNFAPDGVDAFGNPELYARYRFMTGNVEVGAQAAVQIPLNDYPFMGDYSFGFSAGLPVLVRLGKMGRMDTGIEGEFLFGDRVDPAGGTSSSMINIDVPLAFNFNVTDNVFLGGRTGLLVRDVTEADFDAFSVPLGIQGGYTLNKGVADLTAWFKFPAFLGGDTYYGDTVNLDYWEIGFGANFFVGLM